MLEHIWHWRFAKKLSPALQENRLLCFAKDDDDGTTGGLSEQPKEKGDTPDGQSENDEVFGISSEISANIANLAPEIARTVAWSPFILEQTVEILRDPELRQRFPSVDFEKMKRSIGMRVKELERGKDATALSQGITEDIEYFINDDVLAVKLSTAFEKQMEHLHKLRTEIGDTPLDVIVKLEHEAQLKGKSLTAYTESGDWEEHEVDAMLATLNINPEIILDAKPTIEDKLRRIHKKVMTARTIAAIEKNTLNSETSVSSLDEMEKQLFEQVRLARKHAMQLLKKKAEKLSARFTERITPLVTHYAEQPERVAEELGITILALHRRLGEIHSTLEQAKGTAMVKEEDDTVTDDPKALKEVSDSQFTQKSARLSRGLESLEWITASDDEFRAQLTGQEGSDEVADKQERTAAIAWVTNYAPALAQASVRLESDAQLWEQITATIGDIGSLKDLAQFAINIAANNGEIDGDDEEFLYDEITPNRRRQLELIISVIETPHVLSIMRNDRQAIENDTTKNTKAVREDLSNKLTEIEESCFGNGIDEAPTHKALQHETVTALGADMMIRSKVKYLKTTLASAESIGASKSQQVIRECALEIRKFTAAMQELDSLSDTYVIELDDLMQYEQACGTADTTGCYNQGDGKIYLNLSLIDNDEMRQHTVHHEQGHKIVDTLMRRTSLLPQLFVGVSMYLKQEVPGSADGTTFDDLLLERAEAWKIKGLQPILREQESTKAKSEGYTGEQLSAVAAQRADSRYRELLMDELVNKFASYKNGTGSFSSEDKTLFAALDTGNTPSNAPTVSEEFQAATNDGITLQNTSADDEDITEASGGGGISVSRNTSESISASRNSILKIREFIDSHKSMEGIETIQERYDREKDYLENEIEAPFYKTEQSEAELEPKLQVLEEDIKEVLEEIDRIKGLELDMSKQGPSGKGGGLLGFIRNIEYISIMDMVNTVTQGAEDIKRMWKRRGERVQSKLGKSLTSWIGDWVPYAGQLKHEYDKRGNASEIEEVNQWKEAIKEQDSYTLLKMIGTTRNQDQVRAIGEVLVERGRMDWNYEPFWHTLNAISSYNMPIGPCRGSDILRDKWLQKLITDIWGDKDKYFDWRQQNDGAIDTGKNKFTTATDQLSNVSQGLAGNLERQLQLWEEYKDGDNIPEDVNPHLYEKVLHYSMDNGKMSMEEKLFYLVRGVSSGLLSIDRLRALAGENGGILNKFPFIDYFYGKNNSISEVQALAKRLNEGGENAFKPGPKTTLWLHLELTRNESARARMAKATSGARTEQLDHEDIPTIISQMDYKGVEELTGVLSGSRFKMSTEAAKNTYTGFGTKFKILAQLAKLHKQGQAQFTEQDAQEAAKSIASYAHLDNILTKNGTDNTNRIEVTMDQIAGQKAPSSSGKVIKEFRDGNSKLVRNVIAGIDLDWDAIGTHKDEYVRNETEEASQTIIDDNERQMRNFNATKKFSRELSKSLADASNRNKLIDILAGMADEFKEENYFDKIKIEEVEKYLGERRKHGNATVQHVAA
ncbi:MAG: hypothetical protein O3A80_05280 [bacterium]|nr:hypothetical protein [bacterium]